MSAPLLRGATRLDRAEAEELAPRLATSLTELGVGSGRPLALASADDAVVMIVALACRHAGLPWLALDPGASTQEIRPLMIMSSSMTLLADESLVTTWSPSTVGPGVLPVRYSSRSRWRSLLGLAAPDELLPGLARSRPPAPRVQAGSEGEALLLTTSGSTGRPGLVSWSRGALDHQLRMLAEALDLRVGDRVLNLLPSSHYDGLVMGLLLAESAGATALRARATRLDEVLALLWRERATHLVAAPPTLGMLARLGVELTEAVPDDLRLVVSTAAPLNEQLWVDVERLCQRPLLNVYGLTECGNVLFAGPEARGSIGSPRGARARLADDQGGEVGPGEAGELWISGDCVRGQLGVPEALRTWEGRVWLRTGDLATRNERGVYTIIGRKKRMISVGGIKVSPEEVEAALSGLPGVREAAVVGVEDPVLGERLEAMVVREGELEPAQILEALRSRLSEHKIPRRLVLVPELPRGRVGKVDLAEVVRRLGEIEQRRAEGGPERVYAIAARVFRVPLETLGPSSTPDRVPGWDSVAWLELVSALERELGLRLDARGLLAARSLGDLERLVARGGVP